MFMKKKLFFIIFSLTLGLSLKAQIGTDFWFAAPDLEQQHAQTPIYFCVTSFDQAATVTFTQPANPSYQTQTFELDANSFYQYDVSSIVDMVETKPYNQVVNYGFHITSTTPVSIYYESNNNNSEIYTLKGNNALGYDFIVATQATYPNNYTTTCSRAEFVAVYDDTEVTIVPNVALKGGIAAGQTVTVTLNRGQSYAVEAANTSAAGHLRGTRITSNKPIAVNTSDDSVVLGSHYDLVGDQLVPVNMLGTNYLAVKTSTTSDHLYFYPTEENTEIYINGSSTPMTTLSPGSDYHYTMSEAVTNITSSKPISVFQLTSTSSDEMGGTVLPQVRCTGSNKVAYRRPSIDGTSPMIVTIVTGTENVGGFTLNGSADIITAASFTEVPSKPEYSYCRKDVSNYVPVGQVMRLANTCENGYFQLGVFSGSSGTCTYGFFSDYQEFSRVEIDIDTTKYCYGSRIEFDYHGTNVADVELHGPNNLVVNTFPYIIEEATDANSGMYYVRGIDETGCIEGYVMDSVNVTVHPQMPVNYIFAETCQGQSYHENNFHFDNPEAGIHTAQQDLHTIHGCDSTVILHLTVSEVIHNNLNENICEGESYIENGFVFYNPEPGIYHDTIYATSVFDCDSVVILNLNVHQTYENQLSDITCFGEGYHKHGFDLEDLPVGLRHETLLLESINGCDSVLQLDLYVAPIYSFDIYDSICYGENYNKYGLNIQGATPGFHEYSSNIGTNLGCDSIYNVTLKVNTSYPEPDTLYGIRNVYVQTDFFTGKYNYWIDPIEGCDDYQWTIDNTDWIIVPNGNRCEITVTTAVKNRLTVTALNYCGGVEKSVEISAGFYDIDENEAVDAAIFPNPAKNVININCPRIETVNFYNMSGQMVKSRKFATDDNITINISDLTGSIYLLEIITRDGRCIKQFSKIH